MHNYVTKEAIGVGINLSVHILLFRILDEAEFYDKQEFFTLTELQELASLLNHIMFVNIWENSTVEASILSSCNDLLLILYDRDTRRQFTPDDHWLIK